MRSDLTQNYTDAIADAMRRGTKSLLDNLETLLLASAATINVAPSILLNMTLGVAYRSYHKALDQDLRSIPEALEAHKKIVEDFPDDVYGRTGFAETLREMGRFSEALEAYRSAIEDFPDNVVVRTGFAETLREMGRLSDALKAYRKTAEDFSSEVYVQIAARRPREACDAIAKLVARPEVPADELNGLFLLKAHAEAAAGDVKAAAQSLSSAVSVVPYEAFRARRLRQEVERRYGLSGLPVLTRADEISAAEKTLVGME